MREIKFRAWDKVNKRMGHFKPGFAWCDEYYTWDLEADGEPDIMDVPPGENIEFMQFTGLHDKNGVEIYEGDIVLNSYRIKHKETGEKKIYESIGVVRWDFHKGDYESSTFYGWMINESEPLLDCKYLQYNNPYWKLLKHRFEVIGNRYENPELLSDKADLLKV